MTTYPHLSIQLSKLFERYCTAVSLRDMVRLRARLVHFAAHARRLGAPHLALEADDAVGVLTRDINGCQGAHHD